ncbi:PREDICTED: translocase of chloroplast 159, chloroplastic-like isoform X1 [Lupinus angustifolius]|uniref:translocase of chloroplast 159, chloroplastic-like isoform X1 n=1 Tax=Lupinus angustifolius TaxID=3871 RepID=UPI00092EC270|nr:PREDICTED: translocase of chloroplast 159, chloroplastic-like isoform X1 [Lupinus angustifolius]
MDSQSSPSLSQPSSTDNNLVNGSQNVNDDFDTQPSNPVNVPPLSNSPKIEDFSPNSGDFFTPKSQIPVPKVTLDDGVGEKEKFGEDDDEVFVEASSDDKGFQTSGFDGVADVENGVELDGGLKNKDEVVAKEEKEVERNELLDDRQKDGFDNNSGSGETGNSDSLPVELAHDDDDNDKSKHVVDKNDGDVVNKNDGDVVVDKIDDVEFSSGGDIDKNDDVVVENNDGDVVVENNDVVVDKNDGVEFTSGGDVDKNDVVVEKNDGVEFNSSGDIDKNDGDVDDKNDGLVKFNSGGDTIVESVRVNVESGGGVVVVGDKVEQVGEVSEIDGVEAPAHGGSLDNGFNPIEQEGAKDVFDDKVADGDAESGKIADAGVEDGKKSDIVPLEKDESVKAVQDDINTNVHADKGEIRTHIEEPEIDGVETPARGISLDNVVVPTKQQGAEGVSDSKFADGDTEPAQHVSAGVDDGDSTGHDGQKSDIATLEKDESVKDVQDDISTNVHADKGETGTHIEVEAPDRGISLDDVIVPTEQQVAEDVLDRTVADGDAESAQNVIAGVGDDDSTGHDGQKNDIAPLEKDESVKSVQDDINTDVHADKEETRTHIEEPEIEGVEAPARGISLDNVIVPTEQQGAEDVFDSKVADGDAESAQNVSAGVDDDGTGHDGQKSDSAPLKGHVVQDGIDIEAHADEGETENFVDASSEVDEEEHGGDDSSGAPKNYLEDLEEEEQQIVGGSSRDQRIDGQIVTDSDEDVETDDDGDEKELFDSATLAALLKAASGAGQDGGNITITSQDGSRLFSVERPAGLGPSLQPGKPAMRSNRANLFTPSINRAGTDSDINLSKEEKDKLEKLQQIRIKFLRLVQRLGFTTEESIAAQVLYRLTLVAGRQTGQVFSLDAAKESASQLEAEGRDLDYSITILVLGKTGVGKSATINSIFGETKTSFSAYGPATTKVTEIVGMVDGVKLRVFDTPGLKSSALEQSDNRKVLSMIKKVTKKSPPDIVLYVDRLDLQTRDLNDLPLLKSITSALGPSIWRNVVVTLTHGASAPPDGPSGAPLTYDVFVAQRSHIVQQTIGQGVGDLRLMNPNLMNPVSLVENHPSCRKNRDGQKVLPNGQTWRPLLLLLCYSMKILSEASNLSKAQESFDHRRLFGFRSRSPPLPYLLSWLLQSRAHPKLASDQGGVDNGDSDVEADLSDSDLDEEEDEYDQLPPFKPLRKAQIAKLSREQQKAYVEEYDYRVKLLQKKQWKDELRRMRAMKKKGTANANDSGYPEDDDQENEAPAAVPVPLPDMALPPSFDSDNPAYRYRFLEPTSQLLTRPVLDTHSWDHDCGYDGVNLEQTLAILSQFPAAVTVQMTKDKKDFSLHLDSSVASKHGENGSTMAGFDIQNIGKQLAYIVKGETKFKNFKRNKTAAGLSVTFLGENVSTGLKVEDQIALGKRLVLVGSTGTVRCQGDSVYGANVEVRLREADFPIGQDQSSLSLSLVKWRGDLALGANFQSQFSLGRNYKMGVRAGLNNKLSGQISVRTSSSEQLQIALIAILPIARAIYKNLWPGASENYSIY